MAWASRRMVRKTVGMTMVTKIRAAMSPRRFRSSMNRVVIIPPVGIHDPRRSGARPRGMGAGAEAVTSEITVIRMPPVGW